jgi:hypothetical protein
MADLSHLGGWVKDPRGVEDAMSLLPQPVFQDSWGAIKDSGKGKVVLLYDIIQKVAGKFPIRLQTVGDCVSQGAAYAVDSAKCVDIHLNDEWEEWIAETSTEDIYAGARVIVGGGRLRGDGCYGVWAARYCNEYGAVPRGKYGNVDLTKYSGSKARNWGKPSGGVPKTLLDVAKQHPIQVVSRVDNYEQARDLLANGYAITVASDQGFSSQRDSEGFASPKGSWAHQMCLLGIDDAYKRPGVLCMNSWGVWNAGPKRNDQPDGSFWIDADEVEKRMLSQGDCWAFSGYEGFKPRKLNTRII